MEKSDIDLSNKIIKDFCRRHNIGKLSVFGSFLRDDFNKESDIDLLVEFFPDHIPGLIKLAGMENELSSVLGRKVDLRTAEDLSRYFRNDVLESAEIKYIEG